MGEMSCKKQFNSQEWNDAFADVHPEYRRESLAIDYATARTRTTDAPGGFATGWFVEGKTTGCMSGEESGKPKPITLFIKVFHDRNNAETAKDEFKLMCSLNSVTHIAHAIALGAFCDGISNSIYPAILETYVPGELLLAKGERRFYDSLCYKKLTEGLRDTAPSTDLLLEVSIALTTTVAELASSNVEHRDLNTRNIKIARTLRGIEAFALDFGQSSRTNEAVTSIWASPRLAQPMYGAPEMFGGEYYNMRALPWVDIWSLGAVFYLIFTGDEPHLPSKLNVHSLSPKLAEELVRFKAEFAESFRNDGWPESVRDRLGPVGNDLWRIVADCLNYQPYSRPRAHQVLEELRECWERLRAQEDQGFDDRPTPRIPGEPGPTPWARKDRALRTITLDKAIAVLDDCYHTLDFFAEEDIDALPPNIHQGHFDLNDPWWLKDEYRDSIWSISSSARIVAPRSIEELFAGCTNLVDVLGLRQWDVSHVENMSGLFSGCDKLADVTALASWDVSSVQKLDNLFTQCSSLEDISPLSQWKTLSLKKTSWAFAFCSRLCDISALASWDMTHVGNMERMFAGCRLGNVSALENWNVAHVENMAGLFSECRSLADITGLSKWYVRSVRNMQSMFYRCRSIEDVSALKGWRVLAVENVDNMFQGCSGLTDISGLAEWNVSGVKSMVSMFADCSSLADIRPLGSWGAKTKNVLSMRNLFVNCPSLRYVFNLAAWDVSSVENLTAMFAHCSDLTDVSGLDHWRVAQNARMANAFLDCPAKPPHWYKHTLPSAPPSKAVLDAVPLRDAIAVLYDDGTLEFRRYFNHDIDDPHVLFCGQTIVSEASNPNWADPEDGYAPNIEVAHPWWTADRWKEQVRSIRSTVCVVTPDSIDSLFADCWQLTDVQGLRYWDVSGTLDLSRVFKGCTSLTNLSPIGTWNVSQVTSLLGTFHACTSLEDLTPISTWDVSNVVTFDYLFSACSALSDLVPLRNWNMSSSQSVSEMFSRCIALTDVSPLRHWKVNADIVDRMFEGCLNLRDASPLKDWVIMPWAYGINSMFENCPAVSPWPNRP